ncbi:MAG: hypothetical protein ACREID_06600 [Planctomycetota bacterium]
MSRLPAVLAASLRIAAAFAGLWWKIRRGRRGGGGFEHPKDGWAGVGIWAAHDSGGDGHGADGSRGKPTVQGGTTMCRRVAGIAALAWAFAAGASADESAPAAFERPARIQADGAHVDTGDAWGHASPWIADADGDGRSDLIVGDFSGKFRLFRNSGAGPVYASAGFLQAGGEDAHVPIY